MLRLKLTLLGRYAAICMEHQFIERNKVISRILSDVLGSKMNSDVILVQFTLLDNSEVWADLEKGLSGGTPL